MTRRVEFSRGLQEPERLAGAHALRHTRIRNWFRGGLRPSTSRTLSNDGRRPPLNERRFWVMPISGCAASIKAQRLAFKRW